MFLNFLKMEKMSIFSVFDNVWKIHFGRPKNLADLKLFLLM